MEKMEKTEGIITLKLNESDVSEPIMVPNEIVKKYINEERILVNGIVTHLLRSASFDTGAVKIAIKECLNRLYENKDISETRATISGTHLIEAKRVTGNYVFKFIFVAPEYVTPDELEEDEEDE
jgi:hypothetical protein